MKNLTRLVWPIAAVALIAFVGIAQAKEKIKIEKLDDLPRHTYKVEAKAVDFCKDHDVALKLAEQVKTDLLSDLDTYEIDDATTLKEYYGSLGTIAMLEGNYDDYKMYLGKVRELEDKEALKLTAGMTSLAYIAAQEAPEAERADVFRRTLADQVDQLPFTTVEAQIKQLKGRYEMISENLMVGMMDSRVQPILDQANGEISKDIALSLIGAAAAIQLYLPYQKEIVAVAGEYLDGHSVEKPNIWTDRNTKLRKADNGTPVIIGIWDSGVDPAVYPDNLWTNEKEIPGNGKDDDNDGYVDDVHGIAYTLHSDKSTDMLYPIGDVDKDRPRLQTQMKGLTDIGSNIDSKEATAVKKELGSLKPEQAQPFIEDISKYGNYCHGTHVAGIAIAGNPFARILISRITFGYTLKPECPTIEQARKDSIATLDVCNYYKKNGVRVVNMSWGGDYAGVEKALEQNNAGGTAEERKALARQIFEIGKTSLFDGMKNTPSVLYITSAGNSDNDVEFDEVIPSGFDLPNLMTVGAVDQAGDETGFTSFGNVDCYANGYEVLSHVPGGDEMKLSGTSQASPQVTNLAAKILALKPELTPVQVKEIILKGCDEKQVGDRTIRLINPKKSMELLAAM